MTLDERFGRTVSRWLAEEAAHRVPDHLAEVLVRTAATRQRPWWSSPERFLPMTTTTIGGRLAAPRPILLAAALVALLAAAIGLVVFAGSQRTTPAPFGLAPNGRIYVADEAVVRSFAADGTDPRDTFTAAGPAVFGLSVSPDGTRLAFASGRDGANEVTILDLATGHAANIPSPRDVAAEPIGWTPDGRFLVFSGGSGGPSGQWSVYMARSDGTGELAMPGSGTAAIGPGRDVWQPQVSPDGEWIAFLSRPAGSPDGDANGEIWVMHPDGNGLRRVAERAITPGALWAPDPTVQRLVYTTSGGATLLDLADGTPVVVGPGFWPSWSPDGSHVAWWHDGPLVALTEEALAGTGEPTRPFPSFTGVCQDHADLAGTAVCSPIRWSPDGTHVMGSDIVGSALVIAPLDGSRDPIRVPLRSGEGPGIQPVWQPLRR